MRAHARHADTDCIYGYFSIFSRSNVVALADTTMLPSITAIMKYSIHLLCLNLCPSVVYRFYTHLLEVGMAFHPIIGSMFLD
jgi:hypothetical protein